MNCNFLLELVPRVTTERSACRILLEEVSYLVDMLDPKKHPSLYDDFQGVRSTHNKGNVLSKPHSQGSQLGKAPEKAEGVEEDTAAWHQPVEQPGDPNQEIGDGGREGGHEEEQTPDAGGERNW